MYKMTMQQLPFPHQKEAIKNLDKQFKQNNNKALVVLPSGSGKTHTILGNNMIRYSKYCSRKCMSDFGYKKKRISE
jgi:excinuclease UvrABC helicase subunit UvrB